MKLLVSKHPLLSLHSPMCQRLAWTPREAQGHASTGADSHTPCLPETSGLCSQPGRLETRDSQTVQQCRGKTSSNRLQGVKQFSQILFQKHQSLGFKHLVDAWPAFPAVSPLPLVSIERLLCYSCCSPPIAPCHHQRLGRYRVA